MSCHIKQAVNLTQFASSVMRPLFRDTLKRNARQLDVHGLTPTGEASVVRVKKDCWSRLVLNAGTADTAGGQEGVRSELKATPLLSVPGHTQIYYPYKWRGFTVCFTAAPNADCAHQEEED